LGGGEDVKRQTLRAKVGSEGSQQLYRERNRLFSSFLRGASRPKSPRFRRRFRTATPYFSHSLVETSTDSGAADWLLEFPAARSERPNAPVSVARTAGQEAIEMRVFELGRPKTNSSNRAGLFNGSRLRSDKSG